jgi:hypothetical protein
VEEACTGLPFRLRRSLQTRAGHGPSTLSNPRMAALFVPEAHTSNVCGLYTILNTYRWSAQVEAFLANSIAEHGPSILSDPGMAELFAPGGKLLKVGDMAYRKKLAEVSYCSLASKGQCPQSLEDSESRDKQIRVPHEKCLLQRGSS